MPQLDHSSFSNQILWLVLFLFILYFFVILFVLPSIHKIIMLRRLVLTNIVQKGYLFANHIIKQSHFNGIFNYIIVYHGSLMLLNVYCFKKLIKINSIIYQKVALLNIENNVEYVVDNK